MNQSSFEQRFADLKQAFSAQDEQFESIEEDFLNNHRGAGVTIQSDTLAELSGMSIDAPIAHTTTVGIRFV
jgi:hypothetical protein